ncbi:MAG TPA: Mu transposase C-terminal domain-containing protein, partial [Aliidongia sp.]|uniref:Mu transposase C-terminal domain-containing protein n=1 Tax=Aliidongia sp. TaxID=1914230 RepID=UPI002DDD00AD
QEIAPTGQIPPSYPQVRRFLDRLGTIEINRGRMGPRDIKNLKAYVKRDDALLDPLDIALVDGHTFDAEVCHPFHGGPFRPEITTVVDAKTRLALGFSLGLAESAQSVMDAVRDAVQRYGVMAWLYSDNGPGNKADLTSGPVVGLIARLGASHMLSRAYNSMSRGRSERVHQTIWVRAARKLPSFIGADMDAEASNRVHKLTRKELQGRGRNLLMPWRDFVAFCQAETDDYNNRPHSGLPSIIDTDTGKRRHQTPMEAWRAAIEAGFTPDAVAPDLAADLFRPHRIARTNRGLIQFSNLEYFHQDLVEHGGDDVMVGYEWNDPSFVWVKTLEGRLICKAALDGHKRDFIPKSMLEQGRETRAQGRLRRLEANVAEVQAELRGAPIEAEPLQLTASDEVAADLMLARFEPAPIAEIVPIGAPALRWPGGEAERIGWLARNPDGVAPEDLAWLADRCRVSQGFGLLYEDELAQIRAAQKVSAAG